MPTYDSYESGKHYSNIPFANDLQHYVTLPRKEFIKKYKELLEKYEKLED